jgi:hypothetical protein
MLCYAMLCYAKEHGLRAAMNRQAGGDGSRTLAYFVGRALVLNKV